MPTSISFLQICFEVVPGREPDPVTMTHLLVSVGDLCI